MTALRPALDAAAASLEAREDVADPLAFANVYEEQFAFVWRSACRLGVDPSHRDDVVQETFVVFHSRLSEFEGRSSVKTWLFGILVNVVRAHRRTFRKGQARRPPAAAGPDPETVVDTSASPHECAARAEAARLVMQLLAALDDDKRAVFVLAELEQMSAPDIALALGVPLNTVHSRLRLARQEFAAAAARHRARDEWRTG
jgi:RNA polymerase sigma-70 factor (ECF subfamily)